MHQPLFSSGRRTSRVAAMLLLVSAAACRRHGTPAPEPARLSPGNVVAIVLAANNTDISYAHLVPERTRRAEVRSYAQRMLSDHGLLNARVTEIAARQGITPEDDEHSLALRDQSAAHRDALRNLSGARFDSAYAANEVSLHGELLTLVDDVLLPVTRAGELREFVINMRPAVSAHLAHAEQLRAQVAPRK